ncbi:MAG: serine/threonine-protein kinase, partial [Planctomycetota bacterium]
MANLLKEYELLWVEGDPPDVREFYNRHAQHGPELLKQLVVLRYELDYNAWLNSTPGFVEPPPVAVHRNRFPELEDDDDALFELLCIQLSTYKNPDPDQYFKVFPMLVQPLKGLFKMRERLPTDKLSNWSSAVGRMGDLHRRSSQATVVDDSEEADTPKQPPLTDGDEISISERCQISGKEIGTGSFKRVYAGRLAGTGRAVAVKQLMKMSRLGVRHFVSEGRVQAALDHQNIPPVMLMGEQEGQPGVLVEKLIHAADWSTMIRDPMQRDRNLEILVTVSRAAEYAYKEHGIIHRDIKPQNVLVGDYREVYLVDWGLAVQIDADKSLGDTIRTLSDEPSGCVMGPVGYLAPEMAIGENHRSTSATDVFLLGGLLYEILSGQPPFGLYVRSACIRSATYQITPLPVETPEELKSIVATAMAQNPEDRFEDAGAFAIAVERYLKHRGAERQYQIAETILRELDDNTGTDHPATLGNPATFGGPATMTALISAADQFRASAISWRESIPQNDKPELHASDSSGEKPTGQTDQQILADQPDPFTVAGLKRSLDGESDTRQRLVEFAVKSGDLALAESQINALRDLENPNLAGLELQLLAARKERVRTRRQRIIAIASTAILLIASGVFWVRQRQAESLVQIATIEGEKT